MLVRLRWFVLGFVTSVGALSYLATQVKRARQKINAEAMLRSSGRTAASLIDRAANRISPDQTTDR